MDRARRTPHPTPLLQRDDIHLGFEPRGDAWADDLVAELCRELTLTHVVEPFHRLPATPGPRYFRLHGIGGYHYTYSDDELNRLRTLCDGPLTRCMFNNDDMRHDAQRFRALLDATPPE